jgi:DNA (cytosine-5)-methyltransferase 1
MAIIKLSDKKQENIKYTVTSLFCGAGGLDMGFENKGFHVIWANDFDVDACNTHKSWSDAEIVCDKIENIDFKSIPSTDIILGGFPCQGFSLSGPRKINDSRNTLYKYFAKLMEEKQPYCFVAENVKGLLTLGNGKIFEAIVEDFSNKGYVVFYKLLNASDYAVPQDRQRIILVGFRKDLKINTFEFPRSLEYKVSLENALENFPEASQEDICHAPYSSRYMSRNRKRDWNQASYTIPAMAKQVPLHPSSPDMIKIDKDLWKFGDGKSRRFSWREVAAIQTFPAELEFYGDLTSKYKQIGNAVPVKLAEAIAESVLNTLNKKLNMINYINRDKEIICAE